MRNHCSTGSLRTPATCLGAAPAILTPSGSPKSCSNKPRSRRSSPSGVVGCASYRQSNRSPGPNPAKSTSFGKDWAITRACARNRPLHRRRYLQHCLQPTKADSRWQRYPRSDPAVWHCRRSPRSQNQRAPVAHRRGPCSPGSAAQRSRFQILRSPALRESEWSLLPLWNGAASTTAPASRSRFSPLLSHLTLLTSPFALLTSHFSSLLSVQPISHGTRRSDLHAQTAALR